MQDPTPPRILSFPDAKVSDSDLIQQLADENLKLRQIIEEMANKLAIQNELIQQLRDEIASLKGLKPKPKIPPSGLEGPKSKPNWRKRIGLYSDQKKSSLFFLWVENSINLNVSSLKTFSAMFIGKTEKLPLKISRLACRIIKKIRWSAKPGQPAGKPREKKGNLPIHEKPVIQPENIPEGAIFRGYNRYTVQELILQSHNVQYQLSRWQLPDGTYVTGELPKDVQGHYGPKLVAYILHQYHACRVTEHLLLDQLRSFGIRMSAGQLNNILIENKEAFFEEVAEILPVAVRVEGQIQVDDTGGRHNGQNQYTTIIGNCFFSFFATTDSKSRINFLKLLQGGKEEYVIDEDTVEYLFGIGVSSYLPGYVSLFNGKEFATLVEWEAFLKERHITQATEVRFLTEAALYASVIRNGIPKDLDVHSDDAGQFEVFRQSLCWLHEERHYRKLIMVTDESKADLERVRKQMWALYQALKQYKESPSEEAKQVIEKEFDEIFQQKTSSLILDHQLEKSYQKKKKLLRVLERPTVPLHNNDSETAARAAKIKLKISGGTRSELGRKVRDTFLSLKQTCLKLNINFMAFLEDRVRGLYEIPRLATVILEKAMTATKDPPLPVPVSSLLQPDSRQLA